MSLETALFLLRLVSGFLLLLILGALFLAIWRDYQGAVDQLLADRRSYGRLVELQEVDGALVAVGKEHPLLPLTSLGRSPTNHIVISDSFASAEHALVALRNNQWWLEDRRSRNGTSLNEIPITEPVVMTDGDIIGVGHRRFRLELEH